MKISSRTLLHFLAILVTFGVAFGLRMYAAERLTIDYDEDDYLRAGQEFAHLIRTSDWRGFQETNYRAEHPQLSKIMIGLSILNLPEEPLIADLPITANPPATLPPDLLHAARRLSAVWGSLTAFLLALINPLGGLLLAIHSFTIKYTSQVMLDGFAALMSTATGIAYYFSKRKSGRPKTALLIASAVFLGMSASSKYLHSAVGFAILIDWFLVAQKNNEFKPFFRNAFLWGLLSLAVFFLCNPFYWPDPIGRIQTTLEAVRFTTTNPNVAAANYPIWQQFVTLSSSVPTFWNPTGILLRLDTFIFIFAFAGIFAVWRKERFVAIWLLVDLFLLLVWRTKWAQYTLVATAPLSLAAAEGVRMAWEAGLDRLNKFRRKRVAAHYNRREVLQSIPWLVPGILVFLAFTLFPILFQFAISLTDFNSVSIRDGLTGGIAREVLGGITGQIEPANPEFPFRSKEVQYIGPRFYGPVFEYVSANGILIFNLLWTVISVGLQLVLGLGAALLLWNKRIRFRRGWQILFILPWAIPEMIGALMWLTIFAPQSGWLALAIQDLGKDIPFAFLGEWQRNPSLTMIILLVAGLWYGFPFMMLAATAGLKQVPSEVFDAAAMDGANAWQTFRHVTLPLLAPLIVPAIIIRGIFAFNQFYLIQLFGFYHVNYSMTTLATLSYNFFNPSGFFGANGQFAVSAGVNLITLLILIGFVTMFNRLSKADEGVTYA